MSDDYSEDEFHNRSSSIEFSIKLGYIAEEDWPERPFKKPLPNKEREWLASWLAGEGVLSRHEAEALRNERDAARETIQQVREWAEWAYKTYEVVGATKGTVTGNKLQDILKERTSE